MTAADYCKKCQSILADAVFYHYLGQTGHAPRSANDLACNVTHVRYLRLPFSLTLGLGCFFAGDYPNRLLIANISGGD